MSDLVKVNLKRAGIYVMLGKSKRTSIKNVELLSNMKVLKTEDAKLEMWGRVLPNQLVNSRFKIVQILVIVNYFRISHKLIRTVRKLHYYLTILATGALVVFKTVK